MTGIVHQAAWLGRGPVTEVRGGFSETASQMSAANMVWDLLLANSLDGESEDEVVFPDSLYDVVENQEFWSEEKIREVLLCRYREGGHEPWLFPAAGQKFGRSQKPVLVSPRPNRSGLIVVLYASGEISTYDAEGLPEKIAVLFE